MKMNRDKMKLFRYLFLILILGALASPDAIAQEVLSRKDAEKVAQEICGGYKSWKTASWQGKVRTDMLPISPTMKVYMRKGELTLISLRVPLMGEVGRIEIDNDSVLVVNKMKRRYWSKPIAGVVDMPGLADALQSMLLGRVALIGYGELSKKTARYAQFFELGEMGWLIVPEIPEGVEGGVYGYAVAPDGSLTNIVVTEGKPRSESADSGSKSAADAEADADDRSFSLAVDITYGRKGDADANIALTSKKMNISATLDVDAIEWESKGFDRISLPRNYAKTGFKDCLKF